MWSHNSHLCLKKEKKRRREEKRKETQPTKQKTLVTTLAKNQGLPLDFKDRTEVNVFVGEVTSEQIDARATGLEEPDVNINLKFNILKT